MVQCGIIVPFNASTYAKKLGNISELYWVTNKRSSIVLNYSEQHFHNQRADLHYLVDHQSAQAIRVLRAPSYVHSAILVACQDSLPCLFVIRQVAASPTAGSIPTGRRTSRRQLKWRHQSHKGQALESSNQQMKVTTRYHEKTRVKGTSILVRVETNPRTGNSVEATLPTASLRAYQGVFHWKSRGE